MADVFIEHLVAKKKTGSARLKGMAYIFALVILIAVTLMVDILIMLLPAAVIGGIWLVFRLIRNLDMEFEYIVTNGELDIDRIVGRRKRKRLLTIHSRSFEILAPDRPQYFSEYERAEFKQRIDASSGAGAPRFFAVGPSKEGGRLLLYFEPNARMLEAFRTYNPRAVKQ
ncbi:MAG: DUF6106 family protein [Oscillospiraceae bacterium]|nr:DUF6106 family protein [Oscillospiraceae bacterium]